MAGTVAGHQPTIGAIDALEVHCDGAMFRVPFRQDRIPRLLCRIINAEG